jgi:hypothetical protein
VKARWLPVLSFMLLSEAAAAEWLTAGSRTVTRGDSADPDAPVTGYAYGPRSRASVGVDVALLTLPQTSRTFRLGLIGLLAVEDADRKRALPGEVGRSLFALGPSWAYREPVAALPTGHELEWGLELGRRSAFTFDGFVLTDRYRTTDVPFGAGGWYLGIDGALRTPLGARASATTKLTLRSYTNAFPSLFGQTEASDHVASSLEEGALASAALELGVRFRLLPRAEPVVRLYADVIAPHDDSAKTLWLARALFGVALPGAHFELEPYVDVDAGRGQGLLVNRSQLRLGVGVRLYAR